MGLVQVAKIVEPPVLLGDFRGPAESEPNQLAYCMSIQKKTWRDNSRVSGVISSPEFSVRRSHHNCRLQVHNQRVASTPWDAEGNC